MSEENLETTAMLARESMGLRTEIGYGGATGLGAGLIFGVVLHFGLGAMGDIAGIFTAGATVNPLVGWAGHIAASTLFGGLWGLFGDRAGLPEYVRSPSTGLTLGALFGFVLWFVNVGLLLPLWTTNVIGVPLPFPYLTDIGSLGPMMGHLLWGAILGFVFPLTRF